MTRRAPFQRLRAAAFVYGFAVLVLLFLVLPVLIVVPMSFSDTNYLAFPPKGFTWRWYEEIFTESIWTRPAWLSIRIAVLTAVFSTVIGTAAAFAIVRGRFKGKSAVRLFIVSPIIAPNIVVAIAIFFAFVQLRLIGTTLGFVLAHSILCVPFVVLTVGAALERFDADLELAALGLGAGRLAAFWYVTLPIILPGVTGGAIFSFLISFDEPVISYFVSSVRQATLPRVIFQNIETSVEPNVAAISTVLIVVSASIVVVGLLLRRDAGGLFPGQPRRPATGSE
ncbi:MAG: ABC transporter permease [Kiloniellales bacterium]|nr:ABC transporter permease [Kiloniellales bacterium]